MIKQLCSCGRHWRSSPERRPALIDVELGTVLVCTTTDASSHAEYRPGETFGVLKIRLPYLVADVAWQLLLTWRVLRRRKVSTCV